MNLKFAGMSFLMMVTASSHAEVLLDTFGSDPPGYISSTSWTVNQMQYLAKKFQVVGVHKLDQIDIGLKFLAALPNAQIDVVLRSSLAITPSNVLESFTVGNAGTLNWGSEYHLMSVLHPTLANGFYYVTMTPTTPSSETGWSFTTNTAPVEKLMSMDGGTTWIESSGGGVDGAIRILGSSVPEPASMAFVGLGSVLLIRRRRRR